MDDYSRPWIWLLTCLAVFTVALYGINFALAPFMGEDFAFMQGDESLGAYDQLLWIIERSHEQISDWNARFGEQLAIFWLNMPTWGFWWASVATFLCFSVLSAAVYSGQQGLKVKSLIAVGLIFLLWPGLEVFFWKTANAAYLYPMLLYLVCMLAYSNDQYMHRWVSRKCIVGGVSVAGFLAGLSFENVPIAVVIYMLIALLMTKGWRQLWPAFLPIIAMLAGWLILLIAPSTQYRRAYYRQAFGIEHTDLMYFVQRGLDVCAVFFRTSGILFACSLLALGYLIYLHRGNKRRYNLRTFLTVVPAVLVVGSLIMAPYTEPRAFLLAWLLMFAVVVEAAYQASMRIPFGRWILLAALLASLGFGVNTWRIYQGVSQEFSSRERYIIEYTGEPGCEEGLPIKQIKLNYSYRYFNNRDAWYIQNLALMSRYYNCNLTVAN
ncbi:DUF6056 family protein [Halomonas hibernica]|uniref:DUF6056 family protein n=1 Tax=Halomonas hibernica TaxID=2591147 RepID=UPI0015554498|nr:DUF6056 family protein [Halomonas hibernica]